MWTIWAWACCWAWARASGKRSVSAMRSRGQSSAPPERFFCARHVGGRRGRGLRQTREGIGWRVEGGWWYGNAQDSSSKRCGRTAHLAFVTQPGQRTRAARRHRRGGVCLLPNTYGHRALSVTDAQLPSHVRQPRQSTRALTPYSSQQSPLSPLMAGLVLRSLRTYPPASFVLSQPPASLPANVPAPTTLFAEIVGVSGIPAFGNHAGMPSLIRARLIRIGANTK